MDDDLGEIESFVGAGTRKLTKLARKHRRNMLAIDMFTPAWIKVEIYEG